MSLAFMSKKSWHTGKLDNVERVWKAEEAKKSEKRKIEELRRQIEEERQLEELRALHEGATGKKRQEKLEWMYEVPKGEDEEDEYLLGKEFKPEAEAGDLEQVKGNDDGKTRLFGSGEVNEALDAQNKIRGDPLLDIKRREAESLKRILNNPVKMAMLLKGRKGKDGKDKGRGMESKEERRARRERKRREKEERRERRKRKRSSRADGEHRERRHEDDGDDKRRERRRDDDGDDRRRERHRDDDGDDRRRGRRREDDERRDRRDHDDNRRERRRGDDERRERRHSDDKHHDRRRDHDERRERRRGDDERRERRRDDDKHHDRRRDHDERRERRRGDDERRERRRDDDGKRRERRRRDDDARRERRHEHRVRNEDTPAPAPLAPVPVAPVYKPVDNTLRVAEPLNIAEFRQQADTSLKKRRRREVSDAVRRVAPTNTRGMSAAERDAALRAMQADADVADELKWKRLAEHRAREAADANRDGSQNKRAAFLDDMNQEVYSGDMNLAERVGTLKHYVQRDVA